MRKISGSSDETVSPVNIDSLARVFSDIKQALLPHENITDAIKCLFRAVNENIKCIFSLKKCCFVLLNVHSNVKLSNPYFLNPKLTLKQAKINKIIVYLKLSELSRLDEIIETLDYPMARVSAEEFKKGAEIINKITNISIYQRNAKRVSFSDDALKHLLGVLDAKTIYSLLEQIPFEFDRKVNKRET